MSKLIQLKVIADEVAACFACELHKTRTHSVFHRGNPDADICLIGEGPGMSEDLSGTPFVGRSGRLLDAMIVAMGYKPDNVYVCNIVKCRPPDNRKPKPEEMVACSSFLHRQLDIVKPKVIITLGATAAESLLGPGEGITKRHGKWGMYNNIRVLPTMHPAWLLRNPDGKEIVRQDLKLVLEYLKETK